MLDAGATITGSWLIVAGCGSDSLQGDVRLPFDNLTRSKLFTFNNNVLNAGATITGYELKLEDCHSPEADGYMYV